jgi:hypothetical protein
MKWVQGLKLIVMVVFMCVPMFAHASFLSDSSVNDDLSSLPKYGGGVIVAKISQVSAEGRVDFVTQQKLLGRYDGNAQNCAATFYALEKLQAGGDYILYVTNIESCRVELAYTLTAARVEFFTTIGNLQSRDFEVRAEGYLKLVGVLWDSMESSDAELAVAASVYLARTNLVMRIPARMRYTPAPLNATVKEPLWQHITDGHWQRLVALVDNANTHLTVRRILLNEVLGACGKYSGNQAQAWKKIIEARAVLMGQNWRSLDSGGFSLTRNAIEKSPVFIENERASIGGVVSLALRTLPNTTAEQLWLMLSTHPDGAIQRATKYWAHKAKKSRQQYPTPESGPSNRCRITR